MTPEKFITTMIFLTVDQPIMGGQNEVIDDYVTQ